MWPRGFRLLAACTFSVALAVTACSAAGCEAIVGDTIPTFACSGTSASACPGNQICAPALGKCVDRATACTLVACSGGLSCDPGTQLCITGAVDGGPIDGTVPDIDSGGADTSLPDVAIDAGCTDTGCPCTRNGDCASNMCEDSSVLTSAVTGKICTKPCCASSECGADNVCFAAGTGGNYCVPKGVVNRNVALGDSLGGAACADASSCRSGLCGTNGKCLDACCTDTSCTNGTQCAYNTETGHNVLQCATVSPGTRLQDATCTSNGECHGNFCYNDPVLGGTCEVPCCNSSVCGAGDACFDVQVTAPDWVPLCVSGQQLGSAKLGETCTVKTDCITGHCLGGKCTDVCCSDADCAAVQGWICQPLLAESGIFLRCGPPQ
jgi:hypothetical protein